MPSYRIFFIGADDRIYFDCLMDFEDDEEAIAYTAELPHEGPLELWQRGRFVARLEASIRYRLH